MIKIFTGGEDDKWEGGEDGGEGSRDPERRGLGRSGEVRETRGTPGEMESNRTTISRPLARSKGWKWLSFYVLCSFSESWSGCILYTRRRTLMSV